MPSIYFKSNVIKSLKADNLLSIVIERIFYLVIKSFVNKYEMQFIFIERYIFISLLKIWYYPLTIEPFLLAEAYIELIENVLIVFLIYL